MGTNIDVAEQLQAYEHVDFLTKPFTFSAIQVIADQLCLEQAQTIG